MLLYASVDLMLIAELPLTLNIDAYCDVNLIDIPEYPDGVYRYISRDFLRWMKARLDLAAKPDSGVPPEALALRQTFFQDCCRQSGLLPSEKPLRSDYTRPSENSAFCFRGNFCIWDNTSTESDKKRDEEFREYSRSASVSDRPGVNDFIPGPPHAYLLCRSKSNPAMPVRFFSKNHIAVEYDQFHVHGGEWHPIRSEWKLPQGISGSDDGMWNPPEWWVSEQHGLTESRIRSESGQIRTSTESPSSNPLDDLF